jgi:Ni,Fe-hydrogenase maturation factor
VPCRKSDLKRELTNTEHAIVVIVDNVELDADNGTVLTMPRDECGCIPDYEYPR